MVATQAEMTLTQQRVNEPGQSDGSPDHHQHEAHEPLEQVRLEGLHQLQRRQENENRHQEGREAKALLYKEIGGVGPNRATQVLELAVLVGHLARTEIANHAHVSGTSREEGNERENHANRQSKQHHAREKP